MLGPIVSKKSREFVEEVKVALVLTEKLSDSISKKSVLLIILMNGDPSVTGFTIMNQLSLGRRK